MLSYRSLPITDQFFFLDRNIIPCPFCLLPADVNGETSASVASISESVCRPLKTRVEQMVVTNEHARLTAAAAAAASVAGEGGEGTGSKQDAAANKRPVLLYKMSGLLQFYKNTIQQVPLTTTN